jgi:hypothetical protein
MPVAASTETVTKVALSAVRKKTPGRGGPGAYSKYPNSEKNRWLFVGSARCAVVRQIWPPLGQAGFAQRRAQNKAKDDVPQCTAASTGPPSRRAAEPSILTAVALVAAA